MGQLIDLTGKRFGRLVVLERAGSRQRGSIKTPCWKCRCDCGNEVIATSAELRTGDCKSCGCLKKEILLNRSVTHGDGHKSSKYYRLYRIWIKIKDRCEKKYDTAYKYYGGRGIKICDEWQDYSSFKEWAINNGYSDNLSIDRINVNGNYEPNNCRWADDFVQANNRRSTRIIEMDGERKSITEWCRIYNISPFTVYSRIDLFGWDAEKAIKTRPRTEKKVRVIYKNGETEDFCSANIAAKKTGLNAQLIRSACNGAQKTYAGYIWKYIEG